MTPLYEALLTEYADDPHLDLTRLTQMPPLVVKEPTR